MRKLARLFLCLVLIILAASTATALSLFAFSWIFAHLMLGRPADYQKIKTMKDEKTGLFVELGRVDTMLDVDIFLLVFEDDAVRPQISSSGSPAIAEIAKVGSDTDVLSYEDGCYVVTTQWGDLATPTWRDPRTGVELCFRLRLEPDEGPRFGAKP